MEQQRTTVFANVAAPWGVANFNCAAPNHIHIAVEIALFERHALAQQVIKFARHIIRHIAGDHKRNADTKRPPHQRQDRCFDDATVVFLQLGHVVNHHDDRGQRCIGESSVEIGQIAHARVAQDALAFFGDPLQRFQQAPQAFLEGFFIAVNHRADVGQTFQPAEIAPAQIQHIGVKFIGRMGRRQTQQQGAKQGRFAHARVAKHRQMITLQIETQRLLAGFGGIVQQANNRIQRRIIPFRAWPHVQHVAVAPIGDGFLQDKAAIVLGITQHRFEGEVFRQKARPRFGSHLAVVQLARHRHHRIVEFRHLGFSDLNINHNLMVWPQNVGFAGVGLIFTRPRNLHQFEIFVANLHIPTPGQAVW